MDKIITLGGTIYEKHVLNEFNKFIETEFINNILNFCNKNDLNINIGSSLASFDNYSIQWTGYFVPPTTGIYKFRTTSDDASYVWMGAEALSGFNTNNSTNFPGTKFDNVTDKDDAVLHFIKFVLVKLNAIDVCEPG